jgi:telomerase protein component 1
MYYYNYKPITSVVENPFERLVLRVSTCLLGEPKFYQTEDQVVQSIRLDLKAVEELEPSFIPKLAAYSRQKLNLRSVSNFILAWAVTKPRTHPSLKEYFNSAINLPSDLIDFIQKYQEEIGSPPKLKISTVVQKLIRGKFPEFNVYQLGKYCSEAKRKRELLKGTNKLSMKKVVTLCHVKEPRMLVDCVLGKKYPQTPEAYVEAGYGSAESFKSEMAGKRLKIKTPYTWETTLAQHGNKAECWEDLIKQGKLPIMAMLRNLRNILLTGVDNETHSAVVEKLSNPEVIQKSRLFPFRFLSAYKSIEIDLKELQRLKSGDPEVPKNEEDEVVEYTDDEGNHVVERFPAARSRSTSPRRGRSPPRVRSARGGRWRSGHSVEPPIKKKVIIPKEVPTQEILDSYKNSIDEAIKLATALNVDPIRGKTAIFCDCSGSMSQPVSSKSVTSYNRCQDVGFLFGLMVRSVSEDSDVYLFSSRKYGNDKCWMKVDLQGDNIFELLEKMNEMSAKLGGGTEFPFDWFEEAIEGKQWYDNFIMFTDMMISEMSGHDIFSRSGKKFNKSFDIINEYREKVNPDMRYVTVDLAGQAKQLKGAQYEKDFKNLMIGGYSDSILQFISLSGVMQSDLIRESKPLHHSPS